MGSSADYPQWLAEAGVAAGPYASTIVPTVVKTTTHGERGYDIFSRLLEDRIIFIGSVINDMVANIVVAQLLYLASENKKQDINLYIHSNGGLITSGLAIYDTMQLVDCDVATYVVGHAFNSRVMLHQPLGGMEGTAAEISIQAEEMVKLKGWINQILATHTGQPLEKVEEDADQEFYMSAEDAKLYGMVDEVLTGSKPEK